jgi:hypothetical protein
MLADCGGRDAFNDPPAWPRLVRDLGLQAMADRCESWIPNKSHIGVISSPVFDAGCSVSVQSS